MLERAALYAGAGLSLVAAAWAVARLALGRKFEGRGPEAVLCLSILSMLGFLAARWASTGCFPASDLTESLCLFSIAVGAFYLILTRVPENRSLGAFVLPCGAALALGAALFSSPPGPHDFETVYLAVHVTSAFAAYGAFAFGLGAGIAYLLQERALRSKRPGTLSDRLPSLSVLDTVGYRAVALGFPLLTIGIATGVVWSAKRWGSYWFWEPKLTLSLILWLLSAAIFHLRTVEKYRGRRTALLTIAAAAGAVFVFLGASLFPGGRHTFL